MKITVYNMKGSAGKTPISTNIALDKEYALATNEPYNLLDTILPEERLLSLQPEEEFPAFPDEIDVVFDLAGLMSRDARPSIVSAVSQSDVVLVPIFNELKSLHAGVHTIKELLPFNRNLVVVATKLEKRKGEVFTDWSESEDAKNIKAVVEYGVGSGFPVLPLKFSRVFDTIFEQERSIRQIMEADPLARYTYRDVAAQFDNIFNYIEQNYAQQKRPQPV
ncbi:hypothetical protein K3721_19025 (plasmid) [Leisingera caerulea]|uniref:ParA family protein n=2 Tax=Leisingera caerulea TaxID=506591 RepID=A0A9Q9HPC3_LEICA|nr:hypothetical protein K3721_19025 [Leisingera caerulea]